MYHEQVPPPDKLAKCWFNLNKINRLQQLFPSKKKLQVLYNQQLK